MIEVKDLHKAFGEVRAVNGVSFTARDGEITGLLGPNGAGKTTTLRMLYTLMTPDAGQVLVDGVDAAVDPLAVRRQLGVLPDARGLYKRLTATENIDYFGRLHDMEPGLLRQRREALIDALEMRDIATRRTERAGTRSAQRIARRAHQRTGRDGDARHAPFHAATERRRALRAFLQPHHAGGGRLVRPHRRDRARACRRR
jgi:sodium transport system ATP-binding protein